jgi:hypothetical protein
MRRAGGQEAPLTRLADPCQINGENATVALEAYDLLIAPQSA